MPDFLIIGAQRCGTSSLYRYLGSHPDIVPSVRKETEYFSNQFSEGEQWYRAHFALDARIRLQRLIRGRAPLVFEATPDYLFHPWTPIRVKECLPEARFLVLLREPADRAYSHYRHMRRLGFETLTFERAIAKEDERIASDLRALHENPSHRSRDALRFSYLARGRYAEQLDRWFVKFPRERFLFIDAVDLFNEPHSTLSNICDFLGVEQWVPNTLRNYSLDQKSTSARSSPEAENQDQIIDDLRTQFTRSNQRLVQMTGKSFSWS